jgi:hypothetical protein
MSSVVAAIVTPSSQEILCRVYCLRKPSVSARAVVSLCVVNVQRGGGAELGPSDLIELCDLEEQRAGGK